jgi:hypothetical protein
MLLAQNNRGRHIFAGDSEPRPVDVHVGKAPEQVIIGEFCRPRAQDRVESVSAPLNEHKVASLALCEAWLVKAIGTPAQGTLRHESVAERTLKLLEQGIGLWATRRHGRRDSDRVTRCGGV